VEEGQQAVAESRLLYGAELTGWSKIFLSIRFLATIDVDAAPDAQVVLQQAGVYFEPNAFPMKHIS
jgi:hypothetical protein